MPRVNIAYSIRVNLTVMKFTLAYCKKPCVYTSWRRVLLCHPNRKIRSHMVIMRNIISAEEQ